MKVDDISSVEFQATNNLTTGSFNMIEKSKKVLRDMNIY